MLETPGDSGIAKKFQVFLFRLCIYSSIAESYDDA
jgi:hypothetical protein